MYINYLLSKNIKKIILKNKNNLNEINNIIKNKKEINFNNEKNKLNKNKYNYNKLNRNIKNKYYFIFGNKKQNTYRFFLQVFCFN